MKNNIMVLNHDKCTGCGICEVVCPTDAIKIKESQEGFYNPDLSDEKCVDCGICIKNCIKFEEIIENNSVEEVFSAKNKNCDVLSKSTSGGVSYQLMKKCIEEGYEVIGVAYDYASEKAINKISKETEELEQFYGSKYMESYTVDALREVIRNKSNQKYAIFSTPCQIYALKKYVSLKKQEEKFLFVDLFCHGCPSMNVWKKYLEMNKEKYNHENFDKIEFRSKVHGWHEQSFSFENQNKKYASNRFKNEFNDLFFNLDALNSACYNCEVRGTFEYTDIRLGDFWGTEYDDDKEGVSAVVVTSKKGKGIFDLIKDEFYLKTHVLEDVLPGQSCGKKHNLKIEKRKNVLRMLQSEMTMQEIHKKYISSLPIKKKIKINITKVLRMLPQDIFYKLRKLSHK